MDLPVSPTLHHRLKGCDVSMTRNVLTSSAKYLNPTTLRISGYLYHKLSWAGLCQWRAVAVTLDPHGKAFQIVKTASSLDEYTRNAVPG